MCYKEILNNQSEAKKKNIMKRIPLSLKQTPINPVFVIFLMPNSGDRSYNGCRCWIKYWNCIRPRWESGAIELRHAMLKIHACGMSHA